MRGDAKLVLKRNSKLVSSLFDFQIYDDSLVNVTDSKLEKAVTAEPNGTIHAFNSELRIVELRADVRGKPSLSMIESKAQSVSCAGANARIVNSHVESIEVSGQVVASSLHACMQK